MTITSSRTCVKKKTSCQTTRKDLICSLLKAKCKLCYFQNRLLSRLAFSLQRLIDQRVYVAWIPVFANLEQRSFERPSSKLREHHLSPIKTLIYLKKKKKKKVERLSWGLMSLKHSNSALTVKWAEPLSNNFRQSLGVAWKDPACNSLWRTGKIKIHGNGTFSTKTYCALPSGPCSWALWAQSVILPWKVSSPKQGWEEWHEWVFFFSALLSEQNDLG